jgi:hypothetical protein
MTGRLNYQFCRDEYTPSNRRTAVFAKSRSSRPFLFCTDPYAASRACSNPSPIARSTSPATTAGLK